MKTNKILFAGMAAVCGMLLTSCDGFKDNPMPAGSVITISDFEDVNVQLNDKGFWSGEAIGEGVDGDWGEVTYACKATTGLLTINVNYSVMDMGGYSYDWWGGIAVSNRTGKELTSMDDQYNNIVGSGVNGSNNFGVIYGSGSTIDVNVEGGAAIKYIYVANSAYTMQNVLVGDGYSPKFANAGDHITLIIKATRADGTTAQKEVSLAEYTTALSYITGWQQVDLSEFGSNVTKLTFDYDAHNSGVPLYACIDDIAVSAK